MLFDVIVFGHPLAIIILFLLCALCNILTEQEFKYRADQWLDKEQLGEERKRKVKAYQL